MAYNVADAIKPHIGAAAQALVNQLIPGTSPWYVFPGADALRADYEDYSKVRYYWSYGGGEFFGSGEYSIFLENITLQDWQDAKWGKPSIEEGGIPERAVETIKLPDGAKYDDTFTHQFGNTTSLLDAIDTSSEGTAELITGGINEARADLKETLKIAYNHQIGSGTSQSDTVSRHLVLEGPGEYDVVSERSVDKMRRTAVVTPKFEFNIRIDRFWGGDIDVNFKSWAEMMEFLQGKSPNTVGAVDAGPPIGVIPLARFARERPQDTSHYEEQGGAPVEHTFHFDNAYNATIEVEKKESE